MGLEIKADSLRSRDKNLSPNKEATGEKFREVQVHKLCHKVRESLLSSSSFSNMFNSGISNMCLVIFILSNGSLAFENIGKYGILINPLLWLKIYFSKLAEMSPVLILSGLNIFSLSSLGLEILCSKGILNDAVHLVLVVLFLTLEISVPLFVLRYIDSFAIAFTIVVCYITVFLKLISYHMVNYWCRRNIFSNSKNLPNSITDQSSEKDGGSEDKYKNLIQYPGNLNIKDIYYFLFTPTLCYDLNFPLLSHIRKRFLFNRVVEMLFLLVLILSIIQQLIIPIVIDYQDSFQDMEYIKLLELYFKLTIPFNTVWLLCFYFVFHTWLNLVGEILRFGDRFFYSDWWNCESTIHWWRKWNIPVHKWCICHMYIPLQQSGYTKYQAICAVFFVSGIFHEYMFSLPLKILKIFGFVGIFFGQMVNFAFATDKPSKYGNMGYFLMTFLFQPFFLLYYYYGFYVEHGQHLLIDP